MQVGEFFVTPTDVGVDRGFRHFAAMPFALAVIGRLFKGHGQYST